MEKGIFMAEDEKNRADLFSQINQKKDFTRRGRQATRPFSPACSC
jgi:hypothetical protein